MGSSLHKHVEVDKVPYSNVVRDGRLAARRSMWRMPKATYMMAPIACIFAVGGFCFTFMWSDKRAKEGPCIDCKRQQEIMDEVYFQKPNVQKGYRL